MRGVNARRFSPRRSHSEARYSRNAACAPGSAATDFEERTLAHAQALPTSEGGHEPGREVETPTRAHVERLRADKQLGPRVGFYTAVAGSFDRGALAATLALRVRVTERWTVGFDAEWNPWITASVARAGAINLAFTGIRGRRQTPTPAPTIPRPDAW